MITIENNKTQVVKKLAHWKIQGRVSDHLNLLRGLAALAVFINHLKLYFLVNYEDIPNPNILVRALYFIMGFGHQAVVIFFVLSGFFIGASVLKAREGGYWSWKSYLIARLARLWLVLIPALLLGAFWDRLSMALFGQANVYTQYAFYDSTTNFAVEQRFTPLAGLGNTFFLQELVPPTFGSNGLLWSQKLVPTFGSNGVLWSLSYEFWYYILFPVALIIVWSGGTLWKRVGAGLGLIALVGFVGPTISLYFLIWLLGAGLVIAPAWEWLKTNTYKLGFMLGTLALMLACLAVIRVRNSISGGDLVADFSLAAFTALFVYATINLKSPANSKTGLYTLVSSTMANFSYTLYLVHLPLIFFLKLWILPGQWWQPDAKHLGLTALIGSGVLLYCYIISRLTEAHTETVRKFITKKVSKV
jgi:peptidoglycan/LPS O-acetylase OafA/YrhL